jgi:hypothetical protein
MDRTELPEPRHLGVPSSVSKMTFYVYGMFGANCAPIFALTLALCLNVLKRDSTRPVTYEFHRVRLKLFMSLWFVPCKPCTYLVSRLALSPNGPNRAPPDPRHLGVPLGASKMIYEPMVR